MIIDQIHAEAMASVTIVRKDDIYNRFGIVRDIEDMYREKYGTSIRQAVNAAVMSRAMRLVKDTNLLYKQIAPMLGYANIYSFSEAYKNYFGESPKQTRKRHNVSK